jgi:hypothetical protein
MFLNRRKSVERTGFCLTRIYTMSYISTADAAAIRAPLPAQSTLKSSPRRLNVSLPVGPVLEAVLLVTTSVSVSFVFCTTFAGALLN